MRAYILGLAMAAGAFGAAPAQVIYPIDRAEILAGSRFDLKVEFPGLAEASRVKVTVNGTDHASVLGRAAEFVAKEDGKDLSSMMLRDVSIDQTGAYEITAT